MFFIYVLKSLKDNKIYIGYTSNLEKRLFSHNAGKNKSTKWRRPLKLIYSEQFQISSEARKREWFLKNTSEGNIWLKIKLELLK